MSKKAYTEQEGKPQRPMIDAAGVNRQIADSTEKLVRLEKVRSDSQARVATIEKLRQAQLVEALSGNAEAQKRLQELNLEMDEANRDDQDAADAIAQVSEKLSGLNASLELAARQQKREHARELIVARRDGKREQRILELVGELIKADEDVCASNIAIGESLRTFDPSLSERVSSQLSDVHGYRLGWLLEGMTRDRREALAGCVESTRQQCESLLDTLDGVILPGEELPADRRLYQTTCNLNSWPHGAVISLLADSANTLEFIEKGYIEELAGEPAAQESAAAEATA